MDDLRESSQAEARRGSEMRRRDNCGRHLNRHGRPKGGTRQAGRGVEQVWTLWRTPDRKGTCKYDFNRRILKTVSPVVWEGAGAQSPVLDPITTSFVQACSRLFHARRCPRLEPIHRQTKITPLSSSMSRPLPCSKPPDPNTFVPSPSRGKILRWSDSSEL